jgi:hypothetical protein
MTALLLILLVVALSIILYMLREHKLKQQHDWHVWTARTSSFPPPNPVAVPTAVGAQLTIAPTLESFPTKDSSAHIVHIPTNTNIVGLNMATLASKEVDPFAKTSKKNKDNTQDNIPITDMNKQQLDEYLEKNVGRYHNSSGSTLSNGTTMVYSEALRLASLDPEEVVYINENQWFHPSACESYPSQTTVGEELLMTIKGSWILKKPGISVPSACTYELVSKKDAFIFLESNGFTETAAALAPHNPSCEL